MQSRRNFLKAGTLVTASLATPRSFTEVLQSTTGKANPTILLRSSWNDKNIGDIGHSAGTLRIIER
ncbi:twin-arginine translocation signal domain-containing protein, partial [Persicitalea sp.]|uniref:twin-arginine translocation signal domain-containing protein n=1 Tax=Persicitalea sp. TaxID=3100273 RepID=UPI00359431B1